MPTISYAQPLTPTITIAKEGITLSSSNVLEYTSILPQTIKEVIEDNLLKISIVENAEELPTPITNKESIPLNPSGQFSTPPPHKLPILYSFSNNYNLINKEDSRKLLWNTQSIFWQHEILNGAFTLSHIGSEGSFNIEGIFARIYPFSFIPESDQMFRERISITKPQNLSGYSWITFRLFSSIEDFVWVISPLSNKPRQITGSNRSDPFILSLITPEDIFGWSGRIDSVDATVTSNETLATPLHIEEISSISSGNYKHINFKDPISKGDRLPLTILTPFTRRPTYQLELITKDPYSAYGKQIMLVDSKLFLPYYKIVFDRGGEPWKLLVMIYAISRDDPTSPLPKGIIAIDLKQKNYSILEYGGWEIHQSKNDSISLKDFDPYALADIMSTKNTPTTTSEKAK